MATKNVRCCKAGAAVRMMYFARLLVEAEDAGEDPGNNQMWLEHEHKLLAGLSIKGVEAMGL